ncbi:flagellar motor protein [Massilia sp. W12]|uniref:flagellar motor protein n=1 Tax=Massilia sp. W12 TaxID=3126507 RepID=UPI0030D274B7
MDWGSVAGLALGLAALLGGQLLEGGKLAVLLQPTAMLVVVVGTLAAVLLQSRPRAFRRGLLMLRWVFKPPPDRSLEIGRELTNWSLVARREGMLSLERYAKAVKDPFQAKGLRLIVDGVAPAKLREILEEDINAWESAEQQAVRIWEAAGGYAPTIGIMGAVLGLIHVMGNLSEPSKLGSGIAVAFVATIYGVGLANLVFLPIGVKLRTLLQRETTLREHMVSVFVDIASGDNTRVVEERVTHWGD